MGKFCFSIIFICIFATSNQLFGSDKGFVMVPTSSSMSASDKMTVQLYTLSKYLANGPVHDSFGIDFAVTNDNALTPKDATKLPNFYENLAINHNGTLLSFESREMPVVGEIFNMYSSGYHSSDYVLKVNINGLRGTVFYLEDHFTGALTRLETGSSIYQYTVSPTIPQSIATNRFSIYVSEVPVLYIYDQGLWTPSDPNISSTNRDDILVINGTASFSSDIAVRDINIISGATLIIEKVLTLHGNITNNGHLIFASTAGGNGELAAVPTTSTITGPVTIHRYMQDRRSYRMVSSPIESVGTIHDQWQEGAISSNHNPNPGFGTHITGSTVGADGFDATQSGNPSMFYVQNGQQTFSPIENTDTKKLHVGAAYLLFVRGDRSIDLNDPTNTHHRATTLRSTGILHTGSKTETYNTVSSGDFVMFGNPYQSTLDINTLFSNSGSSNVNPNHYYIYDPSMADFGAYVMVSLPAGTNTTGWSSASNYLQPGQAGQFATAVAGPSVLEFTEASKAPGHHATTHRPSPDENMLRVQLYTQDNLANGGPPHDSFGMVFGNSHDTNLDALDALKVMNFGENLSVDQDGSYLSMEYRSIPQPGDIYQLFSTGYNHQAYTLKIEVAGMKQVSLYLIDHYTGSSTLLDRPSNLYSFTVDKNIAASMATDRFVIKVGQRLKLEDPDALANVIIYPNPISEDYFHIQIPHWEDGQVTISISDSSGREIYKNILNCVNNRVTVPLHPQVVTGIYLVTIEKGSNVSIFKVVKT